MKVVGLFAGIGGFEKGLANAGHRTSMLCEIWDPARVVLASRFPDSALEGDIAALRDLPGDADLVVGGFPCQDLSQAGRTAGITGERSGLVGHVFRLLDKRPVPWVVLENVSFMLHLDQGRALRHLVEAFEERGYRWAYRVVNSLAFLPQRRERVIFVATLTDVDPATVILSDDVAPPNVETSLSNHAHGFYWTEGIRGLGWAANAVPTLKNGSTVGIASPPAIMLPSGDIITPDIRDAERLQGFEADWTKPAESVARPSIRWSLVGNAVTAPVADWLGSRLGEPGTFETMRDRPLPANGRWPRAARFDGAARHGVEIGAFRYGATGQISTRFCGTRGDRSRLGRREAFFLGRGVDRCASFRASSTVLPPIWPPSKQMTGRLRAARFSRLPLNELGWSGDERHQLAYGAGQAEKNRTRGACRGGPPKGRSSLPPKREVPAGVAGFREQAAALGRVRQRLFLASPPPMSTGDDSEGEPGVLDRQVRDEPQTGRPRGSNSSSHGLSCGDRLGVSDDRVRRAQLETFKSP